MCFLSPQLKFSESVPASYCSKVVLKSFPSPFSLFSVRLLLHPFSVLCLLKRFHFSSVVLYFVKVSFFFVFVFFLGLHFLCLFFRIWRKMSQNPPTLNPPTGMHFQKGFVFLHLGFFVLEKVSFFLNYGSKGFIFPQLGFKRFRFSSVRI